MAHHGVASLIVWIHLATVYSISSDFIESPSSVVVAPNATAIFRCRHQTAHGVGWQINGTALNQSNHDITLSTAREEDGILLYTLSIIARIEYNNTAIQCVAFFLDFTISEISDYATLLVQKGLLEVPAPSNVTLMDKAVFRCRHSDSSIRWSFMLSDMSLLNETSWLHVTVNNITDGSLLEIEALPLYNGTRVVCSFLNSNGLFLHTLPALLLIQGHLDAVSNLDENITSSTMTYTWEAPFSIDLTGVSPDIVYSVKVANSSCGNKEVVLLTDTLNHSISFDFDVTYAYEFIIIPRSNVAGSLDGQPKHIQVGFINLSVTGMKFTQSVPSALVQVTITFEVHISQYQRVFPKFYTLYLSPIDGIGQPRLYPTTADLHNPSLSLNITSTLDFRRLWEYTVLAYDCGEHHLLDTLEISTHDVQNVSVTSSQLGEITISCNFFENTSAVGVLVIVYSALNGSETAYLPMFISTRELTTSVTISDLNSYEYEVSVFVLRESELPFERVATRPKSIFVNSAGAFFDSMLMPYEVTTTSTGVCVSCTFMDTSSTDCVAVVHQRISQLNSSGLMTIESSHKFTRSGDTASGCIEGVNLEDFQVGAFIITKDESVESEKIVIAAAIIGSSVFLSGAIITILIIIILLRLTCRLRLTTSIQEESLTGLTPNSNCSASMDINESEVILQEPQSSMSTSFTIENIFYYLRPLATKWRKVGNALSIPENLLCSISSTSDSDEECLRCLIKTYMEDNSFTHSWKEIVNRLSSIQEHHIAKRIDHNVLGNRQIDQSNCVSNEFFLSNSNGEVEPAHLPSNEHSLLNSATNIVYTPPSLQELCSEVVRSIDSTYEYAAASEPGLVNVTCSGQCQQKNRHSFVLTPIQETQDNAQRASRSVLVQGHVLSSRDLRGFCTSHPLAASSFLRPLRSSDRSVIVTTHQALLGTRNSLLQETEV